MNGMESSSTRDIIPIITPEYCKLTGQNDRYDTIIITAILSADLTSCAIISQHRNAQLEFQLYRATWNLELESDTSTNITIVSSKLYN